MEDEILHMHGTGHEPEPYQHGPLPGDHPWTFPTFSAFAHHCAEHCDDQLPLFSQVGRGLQGDGYLVRISSDSERETILEGLTYDPHTGAYTHDWYSENINGGKLYYQPTFYPNTDPKTFKIKFYLDRPNRPEWEWETPLIPYIWESEADLPAGGVGSLFTKPVGGSTWTERLILPEGHTREEYNIPEAEEPWTVNLTYGKGGDIDCPTTAEEAADIDAAKRELLSHLHDDLFSGVNSADYQEALAAGLVPLDGDNNNSKSVWDWIKYAISEATFDPTQLEADLLNHLHKDLYSGNNSADYRAAEAAGLVPLDGDNNNGKSVWDWVQYAITTVENHLHQDLYGKGVSGHDYTQTITNLDLMPLNGDGGTKSVWDWIKYVLDNISDPVLRSFDLKTALTGNPDIYLVLVKPSGTAWNNGIPSSISSPLAAIKANVEIEYYDVLPTVCVAVTPIQTNSLQGNPTAPYSYRDTGVSPNVDSVKIGTGELLVICTKDGNNYKPVNFRNVQLPDRVSGLSYVQYPKMNPENLSNTGFGPICPIADIDTFYPGWNNIQGLGAVMNDGTSYFGNWEIYTGLGNIKKKNDEDTLQGGWPWIKGSSGAAVYGYLFNRSVGYLGTRVQIDYARTYTLSYN